MATPITWKNIQGNSTEGIADLLQGAGTSLDRGLDAFKGIVSDQQTMRDQNYTQQGKNDTQGYLDALRSNFSTPEALQAGQDSGAVDALKNQFNRRDVSATRDAARNQLTQMRGNETTDYNYEQTALEQDQSGTVRNIQSMITNRKFKEADEALAANPNLLKINQLSMQLNAGKQEQYDTGRARDKDKREDRAFSDKDAAEKKVMATMKTGGSLRDGLNLISDDASNMTYGAYTQAVDKYKKDYGIIKDLTPAEVNDVSYRQDILTTEYDGAANQLDSMNEKLNSRLSNFHESLKLDTKAMSNGDLMEEMWKDDSLKDSEASWISDLMNDGSQASKETLGKYVNPLIKQVQEALDASNMPRLSATKLAREILQRTKFEDIDDGKGELNIVEANKAITGILAQASSQYEEQEDIMNGISSNAEAMRELLLERKRAMKGVEDSVRGPKKLKSALKK